MPDLSTLALFPPAALAGWEPGEVDDLVRLFSRHAEAVREPPSEQDIAAAQEG